MRLRFGPRARWAAGAALAAAAVAARAPARAAPPDAPSFSGTLAEGQAQAFDLPAAGPRTFWQVVLDGGKGCDLDLRVTGAGKGQKWSSAGEAAHEELLVPADKKLAATVEHFGGRSSAFTLRCAKVEPGKKLAVGKAVDGEAGEGAAAWQVHELPATGTKFCIVALEGPEGVDLDLEVHDATWAQVAGSAGETASEQVVLAPSSKARWVVVRGFAAAAYSLSCEAVGEGAPRLGEAPSRGEVTPGAEAYFRLRTTAPGIVTVALDGPDGADLDLRVFGPDGYYRESLAADADEEIAINGARRGDYLVVVNSADEKSRGEFTVAAEGLEVSRLAANGKPGRRTWGLFVGIANYVEVNNLTYTCGDALSVYQSLRTLGDADPRRSVVLLDELAKRADVVAALQTIAARADEDDVFLFFYSGHGGNDAKDGERGDAKDEKDGGDEFLVCQDSTSGATTGDLVDDDLKGLLDAIPCRTQLLLFDACYAGGMAELVDRPGRFGLFSSLETQTSNEAINLKGGLLTTILRRAFEGEADADQDGKVTTTEVARFVERIQPNTCPGCQAEVAPAARTCRGCGEKLEGDNERQVPVIVDRLEAPATLAEPGKRRRAAPAAGARGGRRE